MSPYVVRALGAVAGVLGTVAIWVDVAPGGFSYWDGAGHAVGIAMLVLAILVGAGIIFASLSQIRALDQIWVLPGLVLGGLALFVPLAALGSGSIDELGNGGWLGVASCVLFLTAGVLIALMPPTGVSGAARPAPAPGSAPEPAAPPPPPAG